MGVVTQGTTLGDPCRRERRRTKSRSPNTTQRTRTNNQTRPKSQTPNQSRIIEPRNTRKGNNASWFRFSVFRLASAFLIGTSVVMCHCLRLRFGAWDLFGIWDLELVWMLDVGAFHLF